MVEEAYPAAVGLEEVAGLKGGAVEDELEGVGDGEGVVEDAAGVEVDGEFVAEEVVADVFGEAGAEEKDGGGVVDGEGGGGDGDVRE